MAGIFKRLKNLVAAEALQKEYNLVDDEVFSQLQRPQSASSPNSRSSSARNSFSNTTYDSNMPGPFYYDQPYNDLHFFKVAVSYLHLIDEDYFAAAADDGRVLIFDYVHDEVYCELLNHTKASPVIHMLSVNKEPSRASMEPPILFTLGSDGLCNAWEITACGEHRQPRLAFYCSDKAKLLMQLPLDGNKLCIVVAGSKITFHDINLSQTPGSVCVPCAGMPEDDPEIEEQEVISMEQFGDRLIACRPNSLEILTYSSREALTISLIRKEESMDKYLCSLSIHDRTSTPVCKELLLGKDNGDIVRYCVKTFRPSTLYEAAEDEGAVLRLLRYDQVKLIVLRRAGFQVMDTKGNIFKYSNGFVPSQLSCKCIVKLDGDLVATLEDSESQVSVWNLHSSGDGAISIDYRQIPLKEEFLCRAHHRGVKMILPLPNAFVTCAADGLLIIWKNREEWREKRFREILNRADAEDY